MHEEIRYICGTDIPSRLTKSRRRS